VSLSKPIAHLTPGPWALVEPDQPGEGMRVAGADQTEADRPIVCDLREANQQANGRVIVAAPELLGAVWLACYALNQQINDQARPDLSRAALRRGLAVIAKIAGQTQIEPDRTVLKLLAEVGIVEPVLSELALTTTPELAQGWIEYAREQGLRPGFVIAQLRAANRPPAYPNSLNHDPSESAKTWYTQAERQLIVS